MARNRYRDNDEDEDDRPRRRRDDDDDDCDDRPRRRKKKYREPPKNYTGLILGIVGGVVLLVLVGCGIAGFFFIKGAQQGFQAKMGQSDAEDTANQFLSQLSSQQAQVAYLNTTANFKTAYSQAQFDALLKKHPLLTTHLDSNQQGFGNTPTGTQPNRTTKVSYSLYSTVQNDEDWDPADGPRPVQKGKPITPAGPTTLTITLMLAEQAGGAWKVDGLTIP